MGWREWMGQNKMLRKFSPFFSDFFKTSKSEIQSIKGVSSEINWKWIILKHITEKRLKSNIKRAGVSIDKTSLNGKKEKKNVIRD